jgi:diguanylate cyclase (GGDEF)-like protein/excisionase family DNA binding protein
VSTTLIHRPPDATLSVTKAARLLGVHPNTIRAWSDQGRLRYYRINPRGDRRYRLGDLQRFMAAAETAPEPTIASSMPSLRRTAAARRGRGTHPFERRAAADAELGGRPGSTGAPHRSEVAVLAQLAEIGSAGRDLDATLARAVATLRDSLDVGAVTILERRPEGFVVRASVGLGRPIDRPTSFGLLASARQAGDIVIASAATTPGWLPIVPGAEAELTTAIPGDGDPWGVLVFSGATVGSGELPTVGADLAVGAARLISTAVGVARLAADLTRQAQRADALRRVASDLGARLKLDEILAGLVDHALVLFEADRAAVFRRRASGEVVATVSRGLSESYLAAVRDFPTPSIAAEAVEARRAQWAVDYANDVRGRSVRAAVVQEGFDTICCAPLFDGDELLGLLIVYHDRAHPWADDELATLDAFAQHAAMAVKTAEDYAQMAAWAAQLQSIQQLGARLARLASVNEIGVAIATELRQLIDYHNVRVYRLYGDALVPVAMQGQVGEYVDETPEQLKVRVGEGITGWVAQHKLAENLPDADADPRTNTIPGTDENLDESMLLAPMLYEDEVLGVLVLSKLGLHQFRDDDLRLLVIYASFAAQAMANADATERLRAQSDALERQLNGQRALLQITESILSTLDSHAVLDQITERLAELVRYDNIAIETVDRTSGLLVPLTARGVFASEYMTPWEPGETGLATWVVARNEPALVHDELTDERVNHGAIGPVAGSLICVPLRGRDGATGVLTLERLGDENRFTDDEFELVKLFGAQVSIALQNAEQHSAVEIRARTDALTGLLNHGTFGEWLALSVSGAEPFSLVMVDLDDFKGVNDALGHQAGDRFLEAVARAIVGAGRDSDHVFRYGGDEFALILPGTDPVGARGVAERVQEAIDAIGAPDSAWAAGGIRVSASVGVATFPGDGMSPADILLAADRACFVAKRSGRGRIASAAEGLALAGEFSLKEPTPVDPPTVATIGPVETIEPLPPAGPATDVDSKRRRRPVRAA